MLQQSVQNILKEQDPRQKNNSPKKEKARHKPSR